MFEDFIHSLVHPELGHQKLRPSDVFLSQRKCPDFPSTKERFAHMFQLQDHSFEDFGELLFHVTQKVFSNPTSLQVLGWKIHIRP